MKKTTSTRKSADAAKPAAKPATKSAKKTAAPKVKKSATKAVVTSIAAEIDVGFGNSLYIRGEGPGMSWEKGLLMTCVGPDKWVIDLSNAGGPIVCKFLLNDLIWNDGPDFVISPGTRVSVAPMF